MARPGFVLEVDDRTPPLVISDGDGFRSERLPLGARVVYPADPLDPVADVREAIARALDDPMESAPLSERLRPGMKLAIAFDDNTRPVPRMRGVDVRAAVLEAVLTRAARAGVDDVALICGTGLNRRLTAAELEQLVGERVFRSFYADGLLTNHDAEDAEHLTEVGSTEAGVVGLNASVAGSDLLVYVHVAVTPRGGGLAQVASTLTAAATIGQISGLAGLQSTDQHGHLMVAEAIGAVVGEAVEVFAVDAVLDNDTYAGPLDFLGRREWEWRIKERARWAALRRGLALTPPRSRRRLVNAVEGGYRPIAIHAGNPYAVQAAGKEMVLAQQLVEVDGQSDVGIVGVPQANPYSVDSITNPVLAAWGGLVGAFGSHTGTPLVRPGGALILFHPLAAEFSPLHHPSYVDFFAEVLTAGTKPQQIQADFEERFAGDPWYVHLYRTSHAFHGVHPIHLWYAVATAAEHLGDVVWVGADRTSAERMGFRAASTLADALEIVASTVGRTPSITYLHSPPPVVADVR